MYNLIKYISKGQNIGISATKILRTREKELNKIIINNNILYKKNMYVPYNYLYKELNNLYKCDINKINILKKNIYNDNLKKNDIIRNV
jgi:hypothetical protein